MPVKNPVDGRAFIDAFLTVWASGPSQLVALAKENGVDPEAVLEPWTIGLAKYYDAKPADALEVSLNHFAEVTAKTKAFMADYDVWLTPVLASAPPKLGEITADFQRLKQVLSYFRPLAARSWRAMKDCTVQLTVL